MKNKMRKRTLLFWILLICLMGTFALIYLVSHGNDPQVYEDILFMGNPANFNSNVSSEVRLMYMLMLGGSALVLLYGCYTAKKAAPGGEQLIEPLSGEADERIFTVCAIATIVLFQYIVSQSVAPPLIGAILFVIILYCIDAELVLPGGIFFFVVYYGFFALYRFAVFDGQETTTNDIRLSVLTFIFSLAPLIREDRKKAYLRASMAVQVIIPALMLVFLQSKYRYQGELIKIEAPGAVKAFAAVFITILIGTAIRNLSRNWKAADNVSSSISIGTCIAIMAFNRFGGSFSASGASMLSDLHHTFEEVIGYSQVFELGQIPFKEYVPVSGMYSLLLGGIFKLFGGGIWSNYAVSMNVFYTLIVVAVVLLMRPHFSKSFIFVLSLFLALGDYSRYMLVLPIVLLLLNRKLIENKGRWLKVWLLTSLVNGLYYPLYGAAVCLGFLPFAVWQTITYIKSEEIKREIKYARFWLCWALCLIPVILCIPLLLGTLRHMLAMAGQSQITDGYALFGRYVEWNYLTYLDEFPTLRTALYYATVLLLPCLVLWASVELIPRFGDIKKIGKGKWLSFLLNRESIMLLSVPIIFVVVYSYYASTMGEQLFHFRALAAPISAAFIMLALVHRGKSKRIQNCRVAVYCIMFFVISLSDVGIAGNEQKMTYQYDVPDNYVYVQDDRVEKLGTGFLDAATYQDVENKYEITSKLDRSKSYLGKPPFWFGYYYLFDIKGSDTLEIFTNMSEGAAQEAADIARENQSVIGAEMDTIRNYYFYNWLLTSGDYVWSDSEQAFTYNDGKLTKEEVQEINKVLSLGEDGSTKGQFASSWGESMDSLEKVFSHSDVSLQVSGSGIESELTFSETVNGDDADFLYIEFPNMESEMIHVFYDRFGETQQDENAPFLCFTKERYNPGKNVVVTWSNDDGTGYSMRCAMGKGKLLIPLGAGMKWLLYDHDRLTVTVEYNGERIEVPEIGDVRLLKLREVS